MQKAKKPKTKRHKSRRAKRGVYLSKKGGECHYRSSWEAQYIEWLDTNVDVVSFLYEGLVIPYVSNVRTKRIRKYYPDFVVTWSDGRREVIEIKPARRVHNPKNTKKTIAAGDWCVSQGMTYKILTEHELKALGLLSKKKEP